MEIATAGHARPIVNFSGELESENCIALIDRIRSLRNDLFYSEVLLRISSPGGDFAALQYFVESIRDLQTGGLTITTHAVTFAGSAAAVMLSLGDVRTAHRNSVLLYHTGRIPGVDGHLTAQGAVTIANALSSVNEATVALLVARALRGLAPAADTSADQFSPGDWHVIRRLGGGSARRAETALKLFRRRVAKAFEDPQKRLGSLYSEFCALETSVSPHVALELGLIDAIGDGSLVTRQRDTATPEDGGLSVPEWASLYPGGRVPRAALTRHTLVLGESGSGKTVSGVLPILSAILREGSNVACTLVIDPKYDLYPVAKRMAGADCTVRLLRAGKDSINVMTGSRSIAAEVSRGQWREAARKILARASTFADSPARLFAGKSASSRAAFWENEGCRLAQCVVAFTLLISKGGHVEELLSNNEELKDEMRTRLADFGGFAGIRKGNADAPPMNVLAIALRVFTDFFLSAPSTRYDLPARDVIEALWSGKTTDDETVAIRRDLIYWDGISRVHNQYSGCLGEARRCLSAFADPAASRSLFFGVEKKGATVDFTSDLQVGTVSSGRTVYVYQPEMGEGDALIAKALKGAFFESVLASPARRDRGATMPMVCYIADEFHRFITSDSGHGEQSFLDRCRSFGGACVLATQSDASVRHALSLAGEPSPDTAIKILMTNTATKLVFRSTEEGVRTLLDGICPGIGTNRVTAVRPPSSLQTGECYAALPDGRFERRYLRPFELPEREREPDARR